MGGLYGVSLGAAFFGESMFSRARDASKVALVHLVALLRQSGYLLLDTQFVTPHLATFGAVELSRPSLSAAAQARDRGRSFRRRLGERQEAFGAASVEHGWSMIMRRCNRIKSMSLPRSERIRARVTGLRATAKASASRDRPGCERPARDISSQKPDLALTCEPPPTAAFLRIRWMSFALIQRYQVVIEHDHLINLPILLYPASVIRPCGRLSRGIEPPAPMGGGMDPALAASFRHKVLR